MNKTLKNLAGLGGFLLLALCAAPAATTSQPNPNNPDTLRDYPKAPQGAPDTAMGQPGNSSSVPNTAQSKGGGNTADMAATPAAAGASQNWGPLYLNSSAKDITPGDRLFVDANGKVYTSNRTQVGYLTTSGGSRIDKVPASGDYQIRSAHNGMVIGQTQQGDGFDNGRTVSLAPQDSSKAQQ